MIEFRDKNEFKKTYSLLQNYISGSRDVINYISNKQDSLFVIKLGNSYLSNESVMDEIYKDISLLHKLGIRVIIVHGGGTFISEMMNSLNLDIKKVNGHEVTDESALRVSEMTLSGHIGPMIASGLENLGAKALSVSGRSCSAIKVSKVRKVEKDIGSNIEKILDLGLVGEPQDINEDFIHYILDMEMIPVISPIGMGSGNQPYTINADVLSGFIATRMKADKLILVSDDDGIFDKKSGKQISLIDVKSLDKMMNDGSIKDTLVQKCKTSIYSVSNGVNTAHIINGNTKNAIGIECASDMGCGTLIVSGITSPENILKEVE